MTDLSPTLASPRSRMVKLVRILFAVLVVGFAVIAVATQWREVGHQLRKMDPITVVGSGVLAIAGVVVSMLCWRAALADLGSRLGFKVASRVFFLGQLGKYVPGSVWAMVAQVSLAREENVPRTRTATAFVVFVGYYLASGLLVGAVTLPFVVSRGSRGELLLLLLLLPLLVVLHPRVLTRLVNWFMHLVRRPPLEHELSFAGVSTALAWGALSWVLLGFHVWLLARDLGGSGGRLLPLSIGGFALAWTVGLLVFIAPAGVGPRDAIIAALFAASLPAGGPAALALMSRLMLTLADVSTAAVAAVITRRRKVPATAVAPAEELERVTPPA